MLISEEGHAQLLRARAEVAGEGRGRHACCLCAAWLCRVGLSFGHLPSAAQATRPQAITTATATRLLLLLDRTRPTRRGLGLRDGFIHALLPASAGAVSLVAQAAAAEDLS